MQKDRLLPTFYQTVFQNQQAAGAARLMARDYALFVVKMVANYTVLACLCAIQSHTTPNDRPAAAAAAKGSRLKDRSGEFDIRKLPCLVKMFAHHNSFITLALTLQTLEQAEH